MLSISGRLSTMFGRKRMFVIGLVGFGLGSAVGGAATSFVMLVFARAVQGAFGAVLAPAALALLTTTLTDPKGRARAIGAYAALAGGGAAVGLLLGGVLVQYLFGAGAGLTSWERSLAASCPATRPSRQRAGPRTTGAPGE
jgi:MFS family permease